MEGEGNGGDMKARDGGWRLHCRAGGRVGAWAAGRMPFVGVCGCVVGT
jgi:hypothetical protein